MSQQNEESKQVGIPDEALPADLVPSEENPLAEGLPAGETAEGLLDDEEGKSEEETAYAPAEGTGTDGETGDPPPPEESAEPQEA